jgi:hypothetical protein
MHEESSPAIANTGPPLITQFAEKGFGSLAKIEPTAQPITQPVKANARRDEMRCRLKAHHAGSPKINSAAYAKGSVYTRSTVRVDSMSIGAKVLLVTTVQKAKTIGTMSGANRKA